MSTVRENLGLPANNNNTSKFSNKQPGAVAKNHMLRRTIDPKEMGRGIDFSDYPNESTQGLGGASIAVVDDAQHSDMVVFDQNRSSSRASRHHQHNVRDSTASHPAARGLSMFNRVKASQL